MYAKTRYLVIIGFLISVLSFSQTIINPYTTDENTVLLMHFDGNLNEEAASYSVNDFGIAKTYINGPIASLGNAIYFDNSNSANNSYITVPYSSALSMSNNWTVEFWIKINSWDQNHNKWPVPILLPTTGWDANYYLEIPAEWGRLKYGFSSSDGGAQILSSANSITTGTWYHVALINDYDNSTIKLILRNSDFKKLEEQSSSYTAGTTISIGTQDLKIGNGNSGDNKFDGYIDELRISNVVRDFSFTLDKTQINSENFIVYHDSENIGKASTIIVQLQDKIDFYKKYFEHSFADHSKIFPINICKDLAEFNEFKPSDLPDFETSYVYREILYLINPTTTSQLSYFDNFEQAAMHAFAKMFVDYEYNYTASEWMKYGFARHQAGMKSTPEEIRIEISNLGRNPTMQEMNNWEQISSFDKYAFAYTIFQYVADVYTFNNIFHAIRFENNTTIYGFRHFNTESEFEKTWHYSLDLFYLRDSNLLEFQRETEHFYLYMIDEDLSEIDQWATELEEFYTRFTNDMQMTIEHKINILFYPTIEDFQYIEGQYDIEIGHIGEKISIDMCKFTRVNEDDPMMNYISLAQHELTHVIHGNLDFDRNPAWLVEGLACLAPDGFIPEDVINGSTGVIKEQVNVAFSKVVTSAGRYPTIDDFESNEFVDEHSDHSTMFYLLGSVLVDYLLKESGYLKLKNFILSDASDYTTLGFTDKVDFMNSFYTFYEENWKKQPQQATTYKVQTPITIDGNINESIWNLEQNVTDIYPFYQDWSNNTTKFSTLWDDDYLYIAIEVLDNNLVDNATEGLNDGVQIFIDGDFNKSYQYDSSDRQFKKSWNNNELEEKNDLIEGVLHAVQNIDGGFTVEMAIPWSNLEITPAENKTIGFDISNIDNDNGSYYYQLIWSGNDINYGTTINFGELTLALNDDDSDGISDDIDLCPDTPAGEVVDADGCSESQLDDDNDGVMNDTDTCPDTPTGESVDANGCAESQKDDDNDGIMNNIDTCSDTPTGETVNTDGCSDSQLDDDNDGVMNNIDICPDTTAGVNVDVTGCFVLSSNNFNIEAAGETCPDKDNGQLFIETSETYNYVTTINGTLYNFTTDLTVEDLAPGTYEFCITIPEQSYEQCFIVEVAEGTTTSGKSSVKSNKASVVIEAGTSPFVIYVNGKELFETNDPEFSVAVKHGDVLEVKTAVSCEGVYSKTIDMFDFMVAYPNPTKGIVEITLLVSEQEVSIELYNSYSQLISIKIYPVINGKVQLSIKNQPTGIYIAKVHLDKPVTLKIIKQ